MNHPFFIFISNTSFGFFGSEDWRRTGLVDEVDLRKDQKKMKGKEEMKLESLKRETHWNLKAETLKGKERDEVVNG
jgi:hypothetical protein